MGLVKAILENKDAKTQVPCLFNPTEYSVAKTNNWSQKPSIGLNVPPLEFGGGNSRTMTMQLFFDTYETKTNVNDHVKVLWDLTLTDEGKKDPTTRRARPPKCVFQWGDTWTFEAVVESLTVRYTLFLDSGIPVRATADVTFREARDVEEQKGTNPTSYARPGLRRREVLPRETLASIAYQEYGDAAMWRRIADENQLDDPLVLRAGQILAIPPRS